jgi:hypothetical protein
MERKKLLTVETTMNGKRLLKNRMHTSEDA